MCATIEQPLISDVLLAELASPNPEQLLGEYDAETRAMLAIALPEICNELLQFRLTSRIRQAGVANYAKHKRRTQNIGGR